MKNEDINFIVEITNYREVNDYLEEGWLLINQYIIDTGEFGHPNQKPRYILGWNKQDGRPVHPENSTFIRSQRPSMRWGKNVF